jgi:hypothetical protein
MDVFDSDEDRWAYLNFLSEKQTASDWTFSRGAS